MLICVQKLLTDSTKVIAVVKEDHKQYSERDGLKGSHEQTAPKQVLVF